MLLFAQLQLYNLDTREDSRYLERLMGTLPADSPTELREFPAPVRVVLTDSYGRYGSLGFTTNSDGFAALGLREALGSVQASSLSRKTASVPPCPAFPSTLTFSIPCPCRCWRS